MDTKLTDVVLTEWQEHAGKEYAQLTFLFDKDSLGIMLTKDITQKELKILLTEITFLIKGEKTDG